VAFIYFTIEGLQVSRGGIGRWAANLLGLLPGLCGEWSGRGMQIVPFFAEPRVASTAPGYSPDRLASARQLLSGLGGRVHLLRNDAARAGPVCGFSYGQGPAAAGAQIVCDLAEQYDIVFSLSGESAFAQLPVIVDSELPSPDYDLRLVHTHGAAIPDGPYELDPQELAGDALLAAWCRRSSRVRIAYISQFMREVFTTQYAVPAKRLIPNISGIVLSDPAFAPDRQLREAQLLASRGIPTRRPIALTWGRNSRPGLDKGHDVLIRAAGLLDGAITAVVATRDPDPGLARLAAQVAPDTVLLAGEPFETLAALLRAPNTVAACFLSASEHGAVAPMEAAWTAGHGCVLVATQAGSFPELVADGVTGVVADRSAAGVAHALRAVLAMSAAERDRLRKAAAERVRRHHDQEKNVRHLFETVLGDPPRL
jgi:glycosyltransferase involved in cell wall biosynthesis